MKLLGIDYGEAKIGLATSDGEIAKPEGILKRGQQNALALFCQRNRIEKIVIGLSEGKMAETTKRFGEELARLTGVPVEYHDETLSSKQAREYMIVAGKPRMKKKLDEHSIAAALILQDYLDNKS